MAQVTITINSREYLIGAEDGQEARILELARMLDEKAKRITSSVGQINENMLLAMTGILIADELYEAKNKNNNQVSNSESKSDILEQKDAEFSAKIKTITDDINSIVKKLQIS